MRLLFCQHCRTLEEVPDYEGNLEVDPLIEELVRKHNERDPMAHGGRDLPHSPMRIATVDNERWRTDRAGVIKQINQENKKVGFDAWVYEAMNTYSEDALKCYSAHHRPKEGCIDYRDRSKLLGHPTVEGQDASNDLFKLAEARFPALCDFCPVKTWVDTQKRSRAGLYKGS